MDSPSKFESLAQRYAPYLGDLHEFFVTSGVPFGAPEDLPTFVEALAASGFHDDMCSMVRSIIYRENKAITVMELVELLVIAVGGSFVDETAEDVHEPVRELLAFVRDVYHSLQQGPGTSARGAHARSLPTFSPESREKTESASLADPIRDSSPPVVQTHSQVADEASETEPFPAAEPSSVPGSSSSANVYSRAQALLAEEAATAQSNIPALPLASVPDDEEITAGTVTPPARIPDRGVRAPSRQRSMPFLMSRWLWSIALCAIVLLASAALFLRHRTQGPPIVAQRPAPRLPLERPVTPATLQPLAPIQQDASSEGDTSIATPSTSDPDDASPSTEDPTPSRQHRSVRRGASSPDRKAPANTTDLRPSRPLAGTQSSYASPEPFPKAIYPDSSDPVSSNAPRSSRPDRQSHFGSGMHQGFFAVSSGIMAGNLLNAPPPDYPSLARLTHIEGEVVLQAFVARDGSVMTTHVLRGHRMLRGAAEHAVQRWRYRPYLLEGRPIDVATIVTIDFHLHH